MVYSIDRNGVRQTSEDSWESAQSQSSQPLRPNNLARFYQSLLDQVGRDYRADKIADAKDGALALVNDPVAPRTVRVRANWFLCRCTIDQERALKYVDDAMDIFDEMIFLDKGVVSEVVGRYKAVTEELMGKTETNIADAFFEAHDRLYSSDGAQERLETPPQHVRVEWSQTSRSGASAVDPPSSTSRDLPYRDAGSAAPDPSSSLPSNSRDGNEHDG